MNYWLSILKSLFPQMKDAIRTLVKDRSWKSASKKELNREKEEIAAILLSVNSNISTRSFPANSTLHATSARYWRGAWKWLNFRSETGFRTEDTRKDIEGKKTRSELNQKCLLLHENNSRNSPLHKMNF